MQELSRDDCSASDSTRLLPKLPGQLLAMEELAANTSDLTRVRLSFFLVT